MTVSPNKDARSESVSVAAARISGSWSASLLWLIIGTVFFGLGSGRFLIPIAAWIGPVFILRFMRTRGLAAALVLGAAGVVGATLFAWDSVLFAGWPFVLISTVFALVFFLPYVIDRLLAPRLGRYLSILVFPLAWASVSFVYARLGPYGTWGLVGYSQVPNLPLLQLASITGLWGFPLLIGGFASVVNAAWKETFMWSHCQIPVIAYASILSGALLFGGVRLDAHRDTTSTVSAAAITVDNLKTFKALWAPLRTTRGLTTQDADASAATRMNLLNSLLTTSAKAAAHGAKIIVWSEADAMVLTSDTAEVREQLAKFAADHHVYLLATMAVLAPNRPLADNVALLFSPAGKLLGSYAKRHPAPMEASLPGTGPMRVVSTPFGRLSWAICYDYDFPWQIRGAAVQGVDIFLNPAWDDRSIDPMHTQMAAVRAVETGAAEIRPTEGGLSEAVDNRGRILAAQDAFAMAAPARIMMADIPMHGVCTVYDYVGALFAWLSLAGLATLITIAVIRKE